MIAGKETRANVEPYGVEQAGGGQPWHCIGLPLRLGRGQNAREHHMARARRVKSERTSTLWALARMPKPGPDQTLTVQILRRSTGVRALDDDNLSGACKAVRDQVAEWLGVDDSSPLVRYEYSQCRGPWAVFIGWRYR